MEYRILGPVEAVEGGRRVSLAGGKQLDLLCLLLLLPGETVSVDRVIDALWGDDPPASAANSVHVYVSQLRKALGEGQLETRGRGYALAIDPDAIDARRFERLLAEAREQRAAGDAEQARRRLSAALDLWRGSPLQDVMYQDFAQREIARLVELRLTAEEQRIELDLELGRASELVSELETLVHSNPLRERLRAQLMLALYRSGRQAQALDVYREGRRILDEELGLEPSSDLRQLERAILSQDPMLERPPARQLARSLGRRAPLLVSAAAALLLLVLGVVAVSLTHGGRAGVVAVARDAVGVIDPASNQLADVIPVGATPTRVMVGEGSVWVINADDRTVARIDPVSRTLLRTFAVGSTPTDVVAAFGALWVGSRDPIEIRRLDPSSGAITMRIPFPRPPADTRTDPAVVRLTTGSGSLWASASGAPRDELLARIDPRTGRLTTTLRPAYAGPIASGAGAIWMIQDGTLTWVDEATNESARWDYGLFHGEIAADDQSVWVADEFEDTVWQIGARSRRVLRSIQAGKGHGGVALGFGSVWVASSDGTVSRIDPTSHRVVATVRVGGVPHGVAAGAGAVWVTVG